MVMKNMKIIICMMLAASLLTSPAPAAIAGDVETDTLYKTTAEKTQTLYASSFEGLTENGSYLDITSQMRDFSANASPTGEIPSNLFDGSTSTKYLTTLNEGAPVIVTITMSSAVELAAYSISSANDCPERDPYKWVFEGSTNKSDWTVLHTNNSACFTSRFEPQVFKLEQTGSYQYYRLTITKFYGSGSGAVGSYLQFSELSLLKNPPDDGGGSGENSLTFEPNLSAGKTLGVTSDSGDYLSSVLSPGGCTTSTALKVSGTHAGSGRAYSYAVVFDDLNVAVSDNTRFSYVIKPDYVGSYDYHYTSYYVAMDIKFTDGTYLSELGAYDQNGDGLSPSDQGQALAMITGQWNYICVDIGKFAAGKTIEMLLVGYDRPSNDTGSTLKFLTYLDDVKIVNYTAGEIASKTQYVKTTRGTYGMASNISRGYCYPAAKLPNGFVSWTPSTTNGMRVIYDYTSTKITHFMSSHQASVHLFDYGEFQFMPNTSISLSDDYSYSDYSASNFAASFSHDNEIDRPNYYSVTLDDGTAASNVRTEIAPTDHGAVVRFTFPKDAENRNITFDCFTSEYPSSGSISFNADGSFEAAVDSYHTTYNAGASTLYVYGTFSEKPALAKSLDSSLPTGVVSFDSGTTVVEMKISTSYISMNQAKKNLSLEISDTDNIYSVAERGAAAWDKILDIVDIDGASNEELVNVYSSLYRMYSYPTSYSENTGTVEKPVIQYMSPYSKKVTDGQLYVSNGFWDTYRTAWPAYSLLTPTLEGKLLDGILQHYDDSQILARWLNPTGVSSMLGTSSDAIFADAAVKGVNFDYDTAFETIVRNATTTNCNSVYGRQNNERSLYLGYTSSEIGTSVSWHIENSICDFSAAIFAKLLGKTDYYSYLLNRSLGYTYLFEPQSGFFISKNTSGVFTATGDDVDPYLWNPNVYGHIETNAWGTAFAVSYDSEGLAYLYGGKDALAEKLDALLAADQDCTTVIGTQHEMLEGRECKMGQYWHSNQPAHTALYLYNTAGQPYKTQQYTREVLDRLYVGSSFGQGYLGDEDNGEQSAWYLLSAIGFYPLSIGSGKYSITSPLFDKVTLHLESGDLEIIANNNSTENVYIQSMTVDGKAVNSTEISHDELTSAKKIVFTMGSKPSGWGTAEYNVHSSVTTGTAPEPMKDLITAGTPSSNQIDTNSSANQVWCETNSSVSNLYDNLSSAVSISSNSVDIGFGFAEAQTVKIVTVSSSNVKSAPAEVTVYASDTGEASSFTELKTASLDYTFSNQVIPVALDNNTPYKYYKLCIKAPEGTAKFTVAEIELLGYSKDTPYGLNELKNMVMAAKSLLEDASSNDKTVIDNLNDKFNAARRTVRNTYATEQNYTNVYEELYNAFCDFSGEETVKSALSKTAQEEYNDILITLGDVNNDGLINASDALLALQYSVKKIVFTEDQISAADVDNTEGVTASDALLILQYSVKKISSFPKSS